MDGNQAVRYVSITALHVSYNQSAHIRFKQDKESIVKNT